MNASTLKAKQIPFDIDLDEVEKYHQNFAYSNNSNISITLRFANKINTVGLLKALRRIELNYTPLKQKIEKVISKSAGRKKHNIPLCCFKKASDDEWKQYVDIDINTPFSYGKDPLIRVAYLQGKKTNELIFTMHHSIGDASTLLHLAEALLEEYCHPFFETLSFLDAFLRQENEGDDLFRKSNYKKKSDSENEYGFIYKKLTKGASSRLIRVIKKNQTSVLSVVATSIMLSVFSKNHKAKLDVDFVFPIDLRRILNSDEHDIGCYIWPLSLTCNLKKGMKFWDFAKKVDLQVQRKLNHFNLLHEIDIEINKTNHPDNLNNDFPLIGVSNIGLIRETRTFRMFGIKEIFFNATLGSRLRQNNSCYFALHSYNNNLFFTFVYLKNSISRIKAEALVDQVLNALEDISSMSSTIQIRFVA